MAQFGDDYIVTQPTWSRDGTKLAATFTDPGRGTSQVAVLDVPEGELTNVAARRPYFFYSWNYDGTRLAALGSGSGGGTALDILDATGTPTSPDAITGSSVFIAWEPGGQRLLVHIGSQLWLVDDPDQLGNYKELGAAGSGFQAAAWVPGQDAFLYVGGAPAGETSNTEGGADLVQQRLLQRNLADDTVTDLGSAKDLTAMTVHPDGDRVALAFVQASQRTQPAQPGVPTLPVGGAESAASTQTAALTVQTAAAKVQTAAAAQSTASTQTAAAAQARIQGSVEILDLKTGERTEALSSPGLWVNWSPNGQRLLMATIAPTEADALMAWHVWDGNESLELAQFTPSANFLRNYLPFADQYDETPRVWSPDSNAITYSVTRPGGFDFASVSRLDSVGEVSSLGLGSVSFWSPLP